MSAFTLAEAQDIIASCSAQRDYYRNHYRAMEHSYLPDLCRWFEGRKPGVVCEVGPGHGTMIPWLASRGWRVVVMDIMPRGHWITPELLVAWDARYVERDILSEPLGMEFDAVVMMQVIPHLHYRPDRALQHCAMMLKDGAPLVTSVIDAGHYGNITVPYAHWREMPAYGSCKARNEIVKCMYDEQSYRDLLESVFGANVIWRTRSNAVLVAESYVA